jgi:hypothetical protein
MPEVPKIVHERLRAGLPGGTVPEAQHPDPDVLTAFAEQALSAAEREGVLQHLARCGECRELVALSVPPMESTAQPVAAEESEAPVSVASNARGETGGHRSWFAWPALRWAALAAGLVVAGGILLIHPGKPSAVPEAKQQAASTGTQPEETIVAKNAAPTPAVEANNTEKKPAPAERAFDRDKESKLAYPAATPAKVMARGQSETRAADKDLAGPAMGAAFGAAPAKPAPAPPGRASADAFEVNGAATAAKTEGTRNDLSVSELRAAAPMIISKAKAATTESNEPSALQRSESLDAKQVTTDTTARQQRAGGGMSTVGADMRPNAGKAYFPQPAGHPAQWAIHGNELQRSLDSGAAWKAVLHSNRPLLCYAAGGNDVWAGGKGGNLFHSANGGVTWSQVYPSAQQQTLSGDVTHIDIYSPSQVSLFTSNNQSWSTTDGGETWEKK